MKKLIDLLKKKKTAMTIAAILVVFVTTYSLILPALTIDRDTAAAEAGIVLDQDASALEQKTYQVNEGAAVKDTNIESKDTAGDSVANAAADESASDSDKAAVPAQGSEKEAALQPDQTEGGRFQKAPIQKTTPSVKKGRSRRVCWQATGIAIR